jgi:hypothetical protein
LSKALLHLLHLFSNDDDADGGGGATPEDKPETDNDDTDATNYLHLWAASFEACSGQMFFTLGSDDVQQRREKVLSLILAEPKDNNNDDDDDENNPTRFIFVAWDNPAALTGRETPIDKMGRVVYRNYAHKREFADMFSSNQWTVLVPNCGVKMVRATGVFLSDLPPHVIHFKKLCQYLVDRDIDHMPSAMTNRYCFICKKTDLVSDDLIEDAMLICCPLCACCYHSACQHKSGGGISVMVALNKTALVGKVSRVIKGMNCNRWVKAQGTAFCFWCTALIHYSPGAAHGA